MWQSPVRTLQQAQLRMQTVILLLSHRWAAHNKTSQTNLPADQPHRRQHCAGQERATSHSDARWQLCKRRALRNCSSAQRRVRGRVQQGCGCAAVNCLCAVHTREAASGRLSCWETPGRPGDATPSHNLGATDDNVCDLNQSSTWWSFTCTTVFSQL